MKPLAMLRVSLIDCDLIYSRINHLYTKIKLRTYNSIIEMTDKINFVFWIMPMSTFDYPPA